MGIFDWLFSKKETSSEIKKEVKKTIKKNWELLLKLKKMRFLKK